MDTSVLIGVAGLVSTVAASSVGFYFTHKAQRSPLRETLYQKQIEILISFSVVTSRIQQVADVLQDRTSLNEEEFAQAQQLWHDLSGDLFEVTQKAGVVLPSAAYTAMTAYRAALHGFEEVMSSNSDTKDAYFNLMGSAAHVFMIGREIAGADSLSIESIRLHSHDGYEKMKELGAHSLAKVTHALLTRSKGDSDLM